jgi:hypothetical protein
MLCLCFYLTVCDAFLHFSAMIFVVSAKGIPPVIFFRISELKMA